MCHKNVDLERRNYLLAHALDWIVNQCDSYETYAEILYCDVDMSLEEIRDELTVCGCTEVDEIIQYLVDTYGKDF